MTDPVEWSVTCWEGNRLRQHQKYLRLSFRQKLKILEQMAEETARPARGRPSNVTSARGAAARRQE